jgi:hypothetical protein
MHNKVTSGNSNVKISIDDDISAMFHNYRLLRASASHCQIDCQISFDNCHLNFRDAETRQN